jgi:Tfp pilus assembly protein PilE
MESTKHATMIFRRARSRKTGSRFARGSALIEVTMALAVLTVLGLLLFKSSINALYPRQWTLEQTLSDAYLTFEKAYAQRIPFSDLTAATSPWPAQPQSATLNNVEIGCIQGGTPIVATVIRTRIPDPNNLPADGGAGTTATNPSAMKVWKVQSILTYQIGGRNYVKSRTVVRSQ